MDIPALGVDGACLSIVGRFGETRGVMVFPSLDDFEQLLEAIRSRRRRTRREGGAAPSCSG